MPEIEVVFFVEADGSAPLLRWLDEQPAKVQDKCIVRIERLAAKGYELRRPEADLLRDGIYELRVRHGHVNYRMLYFFFHAGQAVLSHGLTKEDVVPDREIDLAVRRRAAFEQDPERHTYRE
jgi:phage-related protein